MNKRIRIVGVLRELRQQKKEDTEYGKLRNLQKIAVLQSLSLTILRHSKMSILGTLRVMSYLSPLVPPEKTAIPKPLLWNFCSH